MESFAHPSIKVAAGVLALISLAAFGVGFKESFVRPGEAAPRYNGPAAPASSLGEPTTAQALTEPVPTSAAEPAPAPSSAAAPKSAAKPKPADDEDAAADQVSSIKAKPLAPVSSAPPHVTPPPSSAAPAPDSIDDLLPPH